MARPKPQWELNYLARQAEINAWVRDNYQPRLITVEKILVCHPDEYRRYLRQSPCGGCRACNCCDTPCKVYLQWYNHRMGAARNILGS